MKSPTGLESPHIFTAIVNGKSIPWPLFYCPECQSWVRNDEYNTTKEECNQCILNEEEGE